MTTRRTILAGFALAPIAAVPAIAAETETPEKRCERLLMELAEAMSELRGKPFRTFAQFDGDLVLITKTVEGLATHRRHQGGQLVREWKV